MRASLSFADCNVFITAYRRSCSWLFDNENTHTVGKTGGIPFTFGWHIISDINRDGDAAASDGRFIPFRNYAWRLEPTATSSSRLMGSVVEDNYYARVIKMIILMTGSLIRNN